jgi:uncharacterized protein YkwD
VAIAAWLLALMRAEPAVTARRIVPRKTGAASYESKPAGERAFNPFGDPLRAAITRAIIETGRKRGTKVVPDTRLDAAMTDLARSLREGEHPYSAAVEFVLSHHGVVEPYPKLRYVRGERRAEAAMTELLLRDVPLPEGRPLATVGVGIDRDTSSLLLMVAVQEKTLDLDPVPRQLPAADKFRVSGRLLGDLTKPHLYVTDPQGAPRKLPATTNGARFGADLACDRGNGRYQVEVFGDGATGPTVLANFPLYCGVAPPATFGSAAGYTADARLKPSDAEARLLELVNRDRRAAGLPPVAPDPALAVVARAHSQDMMAGSFIGHISPTTGNPSDRVKRAGLSFRRLAENVGRNNSVEDLEVGLMASPGHRSAILDREARHVGIGVAIGTPTPDAIVIYGTQLFR